MIWLKNRSKILYKKKKRKKKKEKEKKKKRYKGVHFVDLGESFQTDPNSKAYLLAKFGFDTALNEPFKVIQLDS